MEEPVKKRKLSKKSQTNPHYVNNVEFTNAVAKWVEENKKKSNRSEWSQIPIFVAECFLKLIEHYALKGSFRNYCVDKDTEALTKRGWLKYNEISKDDLILSYDIKSNKNVWSKINFIYINEYDGLMFKLVGNGIDALVTPKHRFITERGLLPIEEIIETDYIVLNQEKKILVKNIEIETVMYNGIIWCPKTDFGSFMSKRKGNLYLTGNTYLDEMKSEALCNCIKYCHNFDINKSQNAFAYFTQYIHNSFCQVLNSEKREAELKYNIIDEMSSYNYDRINLYDEEHD